jgi:hypothetical protein
VGVKLTRIRQKLKDLITGTKIKTNGTVG